ncbi:MAG: ComEC/Rec2 family competence protein [Burkholderiales bacterium]|nr:ComEC/Rec2 family competence protein [Burkholderiales bacterium]
MLTYIILSLGIIFGAYHHIIPYQIAGSIFILSTLSIFLCKKYANPKTNLIKLGLIFICGYSYSTFRFDYRASEQLTQSISQINLNGYVNSPTQIKNDFYQTIFHITDGKFKGKDIILYYNGESNTMQPTYNYKIKASLQAIKSGYNEEGFDNGQYLFAKNIFAKSYLKIKPQKLDKNYSFNSIVNGIRVSIIQYLNQTLASQKYSGLFIAMVTGYQGEISTQEWDIYRQTGISHLVSVSGLPLGIITISFAFIFNLLCKVFPTSKIPRQVLTAYASIIFAAFYAFISGFGIPTQRVLFMIIIASYMLINRNHISLMYKLIISLSLVLLFDPFAIFSIGFWFSYILIATMFIVTTLYSKSNTLKLWFIMQLAVALSTIPLSLYYFSSTSISSPLANLWAIPIIGNILTPLMFICSILHITPIVTLLCYLLNYAMVAIEILSDIPMYWQTKPNLANVLLSYLGIILLITPLPFRGKNIFAGLLIISIIFSYQKNKLSNGQASITLFSNQNIGYAIITTQNQYSLVINRNNNENINKNFASVVLPYLHAKNINKIDHFFSNQNESALIKDIINNNIEIININKSLVKFDDIQIAKTQNGKAMSLQVKTKLNTSYIGNCLKTDTQDLNNIFILMPQKSCQWVLDGKYDNLIINTDYEHKHEVDFILNNLSLDAENAENLYQANSTSIIIN